MSREYRSADKIVSACVALARRKGYSGLSISDISREAGVSRITFYRNFTSIEDVMRRFIDAVVQKVEYAVAAQSDSRDMKTYFEVMFNTISPYSDVIKELYAVNMGEMILQYFNRYFFQTPLKDKSFQLSYYEIKFFIGAFYNVLIAWILRDQQETPEEMAELCSNLIGKRSTEYA